MLGIPVALLLFLIYSRTFGHLANFLFWIFTFFKLFFLPEDWRVEAQKFMSGCLSGFIG